MDVTVYPPPPQPLSASDHTRLGQLSYPDPAFGNNKLDGDTMFLGMPETGLDFTSTNQFRVPQPPHPLSKATPPNPNSQQWRRDAHMADVHRLPWSYPLNGLSDEDFNIPPITPPTLPDHMLPPHLPHDSSSGQYHSMEPPSSSAPHHPYQLQGMDLPGMAGSQDGAGVMNQEGGTFGQEGGPMTSALSVMQQMVNSDSRFTSSQQPIKAALGPRSQSGLNHQNQLSTINQSQLGMNGNIVTHNSPSPPGSKSTTPSPPSSAHEDDNDEGLRGEKRPATADISKKPKTPKKKKRKDPNEPVKPVSAYALFFRDTQANIKAQNPNATFGEVSKIVASMWDGLGEEQKQVYKKKTETAKKEYLKQLAAYRASLVSQSYSDPSEMKPPHSSPSPSSTSMFTHKPVYPGQHSSPGSLPHPLPPPQHPGMYMSYPHPSHSSSPGLGQLVPPPHPQMHPQLQALSSRGTVPRAGVPHQGSLSLGNVAAASTPPLQVSPPLHSQAHLGGLHSPHHQHQPMGGHSLRMTHSPVISQGYHSPLQSDYQPMGGGLLNSGSVMSSSVDYHQLGRHTPNHHPSLDWSTDYHGNGGLQRDKPLYLS
ncbi:thymocyte selection-associated high mobility group box protein TOX isoform X1 [Nothobranchius furzeri]|uniref:Thymocyte selection-associated high mobility group box n=2 Tax=Nothobranchius furzeri TaxID=105023 RepID=A0A1A8U5T4_NOTFU|nr:thymocyte selection-associated high mobility group box protein TOX isoform X1 [Nothobranchius furzeri]XP_015812761.1 thymocyte selection-associated high mobility group box protein TOX isoform X1 [Nothobranchius furzeri]KAF7222834.1 transcript variant X2 [Nothobranchius furzeri]KAF7222835.1 transcript variant X1 [Nothobranchius furzeri]